MASKIDKAAFIEWLALQPPGRIFGVSCAQSCPIATFAQESLGYTNARVGKGIWRKNVDSWVGFPRPLPAWAQTFVYWWDDGRALRRYEDTAKRALGIAQRIVS